MIHWLVRVGEAGPVAAIVARAGGDDGAIAEGRVFVGRRRVTSSAVLVEVGDSVSIAPRPARALGASASILLREPDLVAADKPAGMPTIADQTGGAHTLVAAVAGMLGVAPASLHPTSRLDRDVSGVVVLTLTTEAAHRLTAAREAGTYSRRYIAIASAAPSPEAGLWDKPIGRAADPRKRSIGGRTAAAARSRYATVATAAGAALLALCPETGRTHQLRVHASDGGAPLYGDRDYGGPTRLTGADGRVTTLRRIALHAARVIVPSQTGAALTIEAPVPSELVSLWHYLGGDVAAFGAALHLVL